jgi:hypothetical protein
VEDILDLWFFLRSDTLRECLLDLTGNGMRASKSRDKVESFDACMDRRIRLRRLRRIMRQYIEAKGLKWRALTEWIFKEDKLDSELLG